MSGTDLYRRVIAFDYGDQECSDLTRKVWAPTPWMIEVYTGNYRDGREYEILQWCHVRFGDESSPIHRRTGIWHRGNATIHGWTWYGFASESDMRCFVDRWPTPEGVKHPEREPA